MNKTNYLKFMGYRYWKNTQGADQTLALAKDDTATNAAALNFGEFALLGTDGTDLLVVITDNDGSGVRVANTATTNYKTGATFDSATNVTAGDVTLIPSGGYSVHATSGVITIEASGGTGGDGYDLASGDIAEVWSYYGAGTGSGHQHDGLVVPATNLTGIDPLSAVCTRISFKSVLGTQVDDNVVLIHGSGKYKDVCRMMEAACNAHPHGGQLITVADVGTALTSGPSLPLVDQFDLGIIGVSINYAA